MKIDHNTAIETGSIIVANGAPNPGLVFTNNISVHNRYAILGGNYGVGKPAIHRYLLGADIRKNVIVMNVEDGSASYPSDNYFPSTLKTIGFVSLTNNADLRPKESSAYHNRATAHVQRTASAFSTSNLSSSKAFLLHRLRRADSLTVASVLSG